LKNALMVMIIIFILMQIEQQLGVLVVMIPIDECYDDSQCSPSHGCTNELVIDSKTPLLVNANASALTGVRSYVRPICQCSSQMMDIATNRCSRQTCLNGGTCQQVESNFK
jgi:hypothetical protein